MQSRTLMLLFAFSALAILDGSATAAPSRDETALTSQARQTDSLAKTRGSTTVSDKISSDYSGFAGSSANSDSLVSGLRNGAPITLTSTDAKGVTTSTTFTPPTGKMGYGNVSISLALAKQDLANAGITQPTPQQLQTALMGGTITTGTGQTATTTRFSGVLQMRADGMGWGKIANSLGMKLGPVISGMKANNAQLASQPVTSSPGTTTVSATTTASTHSHTGVVTGAGAGVSNSSHSSGIVTASGGQAGVTSAHGGNGQAGGAASHGIVTGNGSSVGGSQGKAVGHR